MNLKAKVERDENFPIKKVNNRTHFFERVYKTKEVRQQKSTKIIKQLSNRFHSKSEVEGLYQTLSEYASLNGLVISKINKGNLVAVTKSSLSTSKKKKNFSTWHFIFIEALGFRYR